MGIAKHIELLLVGPVSVVAVVPGAEVEMVTKTDFPLAGPRTLGHDRRAGDIRGIDVGESYPSAARASMFGVVER